MFWNNFERKMNSLLSNFKRENYIMKIIVRISGLILVKLLLFYLFIGCNNQTSDQIDKKANSYQNPVVAKSLPDPTIIKASDGFFYLYATEDIRHTPIYKSKDLAEWDFVGTAFTAESRPDFEPKGGLWAPDINYINGQYVLYYSMSVWGGEWTCGIGVSSSDSPAGPFTDQGKLFRSNEIGVQNSIDPFYIEESGRHYLFWGSFRGIYYIELTHNGLAILPEAEKQQIAGTAYEGVYIHKKDNWYYLFASIGSCCEGVNSTYTTVVGRSDNLFGPYKNKSGQTMMENSHEILIRKNDRFVGTGHNSEVVTDDAGNSWLLYHAVDKTNPDGRVLMLDELQWKDGWPFVNNGTPSLEWKRPIFN
jgi:arabinan endo-1,5-alpha-L-arabinosidase